MIPGSWLDATTDEDVAADVLADLSDDERTITQLMVGQAEFAALLVYAGPAEPVVIPGRRHLVPRRPVRAHRRGILPPPEDR